MKLYKILLFLFELASVLRFCSGLYEDQAGQNDWFLQNIGTYEQVLFFGQTAYVASKLGVVAAISMKTSEVQWRQVIENEEILKLGFLQITPEKTSGKRLYSIGKTTSGTYAIRLWDTLYSGLIWDSVVETEVLARMLQVRVLKHNTNESQVVGPVLIIMFSDRIVALSVKKGTSLFAIDSTPNVKNIAWKGFWANTDGAVVVFGETPDRNLHVGSISLNDKKLNSLIHVESIGKVFASPWHVSIQEEGEEMSNFVCVLNENKKVVLYDPVKISIVTHAIELNDDEHEVLFTHGSNHFNLKTISSTTEHNTVFRLSDGGKRLDQVFVASNAILTISNDDRSSEAAHILALEQSDENNLLRFAWMPPDKVKPSLLTIEEETYRGKPVKVFEQISSKLEGSARVLVRYEDGSIAAYHLKYNDENPVTSLWIREEGLAEIVSKPLSVEIPRRIRTNENEELLRQLAEPSSARDPSVLIVRFRSQLRTFIASVRGLFELLAGLTRKIIQSRGQWLVKAYRGELDTSGYTEAEKSNFGFIRALILISAKGKIFAINSETGVIIWSYFNSNFAKDDARLFLTRIRMSGVLPPELLVLTKDGNASYFNALNGELLRKESSTDSTITEAIDIPTAYGSLEAHPDRAVLTLDSNKYVRVYPSNRVISEEILEHTVVFNVDKDLDSIVGYKIQKSTMKAIEFWSISMPEKHKVVGIQMHQKDAVNSPGRNIGGGSLMIKAINNHLVAIASQAEGESSITMTFFDAITGRIVERFIHKNCVPPIHIVMFENSAVYSSWNEKFKRTDIFVLSVFESTIVEKYQLNPWNGVPEPLKASQYSSFDIKSQNLIVQQKGFYFNSPISALGVTSTRKGITERNVLIGTVTGQVNAVDSRLLDPRRPVGTLSKQETEEGLIGYFGEIPMIPQRTLTYYHLVEMIRFVHTIPTKLESTCLVVVIGLDIFYTRLQPSEGFDLIAEEFNYPLLIMMTFGLFLATIIAKRAVRTKRLESKWK